MFGWKVLCLWSGEICSGYGALATKFRRKVLSGEFEEGIRTAHGISESSGEERGYHIWLIVNRLGEDNGGGKIMSGGKIMGKHNWITCSKIERDELENWIDRESSDSGYSGFENSGLDSEFLDLKILDCIRETLDRTPACAGRKVHCGRAICGDHTPKDRLEERRPGDRVVSWHCALGRTSSMRAFCSGSGHSFLTNVVYRRFGEFGELKNRRIERRSIGSQR